MDSATPFQPWAGDDRKNVKTEREVDDAKLHRENVNPKHTQTASYDKESVAASSIVPGSSSSTGTAGALAHGKESKMDPAKIASMQQIVENSLSQEGRQRVSQLLDAVEALSGTERLLLYLRLPTGIPPQDPLKQPINPLGSRAELQQTVTWIQTHLEVDPDVSLPKQDVYDEYIAHCMSSNMKPLSTADFGKVMKQVYPTVRPRRLGTRGNSRYCYAGLRKKIKLEVPQLPDLGESSKEIISSTSKESERIICDWAETKLGVKLASISELSRHLASTRVPPGPASASPPLPPMGTTQVDDPTGRQLMKHLKRKIQTQGTPGRPKKNKAVELANESPPSTSYAGHVKHEGEPEYYPAYYERYYPPPRAHPAPPLDYRGYACELYPRDLTLPAPPPPPDHGPINLSSDASLDLSTERADWQRRRPPEPPPPRLPLPGKKLILETYQSETQAGSPRPAPPPQPLQPPLPPEDFPRTEYLPKKMRAAEILGGKLAAARHALAGADAASTSAAPAPAAVERSVRPEVAFLEDPKNLTSRSKSTAAALAREEQEAASPTRSAKAPTPRADRGKGRRASRRGSPDRASPDSCCGLDGINIKTGVICEEGHSEILNRERVISICNIDKHDLDDYLNEGNSQEHEEELSKYFQRDAEPPAPPAPAAAGNTSDPAAFLEAGLDPQDDHSQGKNEKLSQLRELLAKNLKNQSGSSSQAAPILQEVQIPVVTSEGQHFGKPVVVSEGAFKPVATEITNGIPPMNSTEIGIHKHTAAAPTQNGTALPFPNHDGSVQINNNAAAPHLYNGNCHTEPQSPTTRTQQYDFVPISDGCHSPGNFGSKSPLGFGQRGLSPSKTNKPIIMGGSLQTSPISHSHSTAASPFVSPRNTPVPRSRLCPRPIPKHNGKLKRRNPLSLGVADSCVKQFAIPNEQKFLAKTAVKYCQPMSAPPSPNILSQYKNHMFACNSAMANGNANMCLNFLPNTLTRDNMNGELAHPLSADPLSSEVSQFFQESPVAYRHDQAFRSQSVPLKQGVAVGLLSYAGTPVGSVPPTPVPNEFCDFGTLGDACDISKAGLNPETLDKIYDAIDSNSDVLHPGEHQTLLNSNDTLSNGCDPLPEQAMLADGQLNPYIPSGPGLIDRNTHYNQPYSGDTTATDHVDDLLKRTNSMEFDLAEMDADRSKYYMSRSVPSTPLPFKRTVPNLQIDSRRSRELFPTENYSAISNGISSKSVPSTPQLAEDRSVFSYSNRDFLINGNSVELCGGGAGLRAALSPPLADILGEDALSLAPAADLLADLDKMDANPYDL